MLPTLQAAPAVPGFLFYLHSEDDGRVASRALLALPSCPVIRAARRKGEA